MRRFFQFDDQECAIRARRGEAGAFAELVKRYQDKIFRFLLRLVHSRDDAMDLAQDTFMRAYQGLGRWEPEAPFRSWLFRIARNLAFDQLRHGRLVEFVEFDDSADLPDRSQNPELALETAQRYGALEAALQRMPVEQREMILLREIEGLSYEEMAQVLELPPGTVKSRLSRARLALMAMTRARKEMKP